MKISELISKLDYHFNDEHGQAVTDPDRARALLDVEIQDITNDSRKIRQDCLFFCISGAQFDGHDFASMIPVMPWPLFPPRGSATLPPV